MGGEVHVFYSELQGEARATIKHLRRATATEWLVTQHNPPKGQGRKVFFELRRNGGGGREGGGGWGGGGGGGGDEA
jgi:hypothetical protein